MGDLSYLDLDLVNGLLEWEILYGGAKKLKAFNTEMRYALKATDEKVK